MQSLVFSSSHIIYRLATPTLFLFLSVGEMAKAVTILLLLLGAVYLRICCAASLNSSAIDRSSLLAIKKHIDSDILANNWSQQTSFCTWIGVTCSPRHPRVISLELSNMKSETSHSSRP